MADVRISDLPSTDLVGRQDIVPIVQVGSTKRVTVSGFLIQSENDLRAYADQAEIDAIATASGYTDGKFNEAVTTVSGYTDSKFNEAVATASGYAIDSLNTAVATSSGYAIDSLNTANAYTNAQVDPLNDFRIWDATRVYDTNDPTFREGVPYRSLITSNSGFDPLTNPDKWEIVGSTGTGDVRETINANKTYSILIAHHRVVCNNTANITVNIEAGATQPGTIFQIVRIGTGTVSLQGGASQLLEQNNHVVKVWTGSSWLNLVNATAAATAGRLVLRDASGRAAFTTPAAAGDAATKGYVDGLLGGITFNTPIVTAHGGSVGASVTIPALSIGFTMVYGYGNKNSTVEPVSVLLPTGGTYRIFSGGIAGGTTAAGDNPVNGLYRLYGDASTQPGGSTAAISPQMGNDARFAYSFIIQRVS